MLPKYLYAYPSLVWFAQIYRFFLLSVLICFTTNPKLQQDVISHILFYDGKVALNSVNMCKSCMATQRSNEGRKKTCVSFRLIWTGRKVVSCEEKKLLKSHSYSKNGNSQS